MQSCTEKKGDYSPASARSFSKSSSALSRSSSVWFWSLLLAATGVVSSIRVRVLRSTVLPWNGKNI